MKSLAAVNVVSSSQALLSAISAVHSQKQRRNTLSLFGFLTFSCLNLKFNFRLSFTDSRKNGFSIISAVCC